MSIVSTPIDPAAPVAASPAGRSRAARGRAWLGRRGVGFRVGAALLVALTLLALVGAQLTPYPPLQVAVGPQLASPSGAHLFGTDELGRDVFSRVVAGVGTSLIVGVGAAALATGIGILVGSVAGYRGGAGDALLMRTAELFMIIPQFFLAVVLVIVFGASMATMILVIGVLGWPLVARVVRAEVVSLKTRVYVSAARTIGVSGPTVVVREILPNAAARIAVVAAAQVAQAVLLEASLGYLGVDNPNRVSLGSMLQDAQPLMQHAPWTALFPAAALFLLILAINLVADELGVATDAPDGRRGRLRLPRTGRRRARA